MSTGLDRLRRNYKPALLSYVGHRSEVGLHAAYELGRSALAARVSLLDLVQIHHDVLVDVLTTARDDEVRDLFCAGATFLVEALAAADMAQRGFVETTSGDGGSVR